ncbi:hypothetical protein EKO04_002180 [Ascochyta lentis]|uniref:Uncharacterized protein n=1 Tax=Ascochyta lentis TaxID=205686 RepID=A0A8H7MG27_9PLEO|nr:hypothetical protein EKO04_002180 [Ascochyta lentis]
MSKISNTPRRPSTAQPGSLSTRMSYEAGEALLWERQNHRVNAHLSIQVKELQTQHDAYNSRIQATESIAEAAEAAVYKVKQMEARIAAMEADDQDRPFDAYAKEAIGQFQVFVDSHKGVRQKLSGLEQKVGNLNEDTEDMRDARGLLNSMMRRLEVLEEERKEEGEKVRKLEKEMETLRRISQRQEPTGDEVELDDDPLQIFDNDDTQPGPWRQNTGLRGSERPYEDGRLGRFTQSPEQRHRHSANDPLPRHGDMKPPVADIVRSEEESISLLEPEPQVQYGWENTQQFKDMQAELAALRAMCQTQGPKSNRQLADATQQPQETIVLPKEHDPGFSDATTDTEADYNDADRRRVDIRVSTVTPRRVSLSAVIQQ